GTEPGRSDCPLFGVAQYVGRKRRKAARYARRGRGKTQQRAGCTRQPRQRLGRLREADSMTDLAEIVRERCEAKIREGKRPSKADREWYELVTESIPFSSVAKSRSVAKGETGIDVK